MCVGKWACAQQKGDSNDEDGHKPLLLGAPDVQTRMDFLISSMVQNWVGSQSNQWSWSRKVLCTQTWMVDSKKWIWAGNVKIIDRFGQENLMKLMTGGSSSLVRLDKHLPYRVMLGPRSKLIFSPTIWSWLADQPTNQPTDWWLEIMSCPKAVVGFYTRKLPLNC